jgi:hypothetical protein
MVVISVPLRLRLAALGLLFCIPLIAFEIVIANRASWWSLPYRGMGYWSLAFALICIPLSSWLMNAKRWAYPIAVVLAALWIGASAWVSIRMRYPPLGFFTLFLSAFFLIELLWLKFELDRSFFNPQLAWYQGLPKPIPGLRCQLVSGEKTLDVRVSRIDPDGAFIFSPFDLTKSPISLPSLLERKKLEMVFNFREYRFVCQGTPTLSFNRGVGAGVRFFGVSSDLRKEIGDFVEILRGEGYV